MDILDRIFSIAELERRPPVLMDVGASVRINPQWKRIAKYSICLAFDADARGMAPVHLAGRHYKKLIVLPSVLVAGAQDKSPFYLTKAPQCSSTLSPRSDALSEWGRLQPGFAVEREELVSATSVASALSRADVDYLDWFKSDSQGTDLRLFMSIDEAIRRRIIAAELEPGIIDAYLGEDKLWHVMRFMDSEPFWLSECRIKGSPRISRRLLADLDQRTTFLLSAVQSPSPGWAELTYLNTGEGMLDLRSLMLMWVFAMLHEQYGFALMIAKRGQELELHPLFRDLEAVVASRMRRAMPRATLQNLEALLRRARTFLFRGGW